MEIKGGDVGIIKLKDLSSSRTQQSIPAKADFYIKKMMFKKNKYIESSTYKIFGSFNYKLQPYPGDVDSTNIVKFKKSVSEENAIKISATMIRDIVLKLSKVKNYTISDLKCGVHDNNESIHWSNEEIIKGYREAGVVDKNGNSSNRKITLVDALGDIGAMCKLDLIAPLMGRYAEITVLYQIYAEGVAITKTIEEEDDEHLNLLLDTLKQIKKGKLFKVIKRLFSYARLTKNNKLLRYFEPFINSNLSKLASYKSDLETLELILENNKYPSMQTLKDELDRIKFGIDNILDLDINKTNVYDLIDQLLILIKNKHKNDSLSIIKKIKKIFEETLNKETVTLLGKRGTRELNDIFKKINTHLEKVEKEKKEKEKKEKEKEEKEKK